MNAPLNPDVKLYPTMTRSATGRWTGSVDFVTSSRSADAHVRPLEKGENSRTWASVLLAPLAAVLLCWAPARVFAQDAPKAPAQQQAQAKPNTPNTPKPAGPTEPGKAESPPSPTGPETGPSSEEMQLSFQGANIEMVVQWLAKATGKSVVKHPRVQCQLTIVSSKKLGSRDAINLVYRALALEGFTTIETSKSILIVPEGQEPKMSPEFLDNSRAETPEGRQRLVKIFPLKNAQAAELREKIRAVLSEKATIDVAERANQLIVTDYTDNIRLLGELIKELDIPAGGDTVIEFYSLKHSEAEELGALLSLVLNSQPAPPPSSSRSPSQPARSSPQPPGMVGGPQPPMVNPEPPGGGAASTPSAGAQGSQQIRIWPDKTSNRLIVAAPKSKLPEIQRLIEVLDTEKPQDVSIRVLPLKNVNAEDLVKDIGPLYQKMSGKSLKDTIEVASNSRANSLVILSSEANFKAIEKLVSALDTEEAQEKAMRDFPLRNADAEDVAKQLQDLNQDPDSSSSRFPYYIFSSYGMGARSSKKATFVADRRRNTVIVQAPPAALESIAKMIEDLDQPVTDNSLAPKIFRLKYVSASDIEDVLNELFLKKQQQRSYFDLYGYPAQDTGDRQNAGRLYGKVRITSEPYANAIIVTSNSPENLAAVEEVLKQLDVPSQAGESTLRLGLRFAKASIVANNINILFAKNGSPPLRQINQPGQQNAVNPLQQQQQQQNNSYQGNFAIEQEAREEGYFPWLGGQPDNPRTADGRNAIRPVSDLVGRVRVVPDDRSNSLLISATVHFFPQILKLIEDLDAPTAQVLIEAKIVEVSSDFLEKLGVRWSPDGAKTFTADDYDNSILAHVKGDYVKQFGSALAPFGGAGGVASGLANSLHSGILDATLSMDFLVQFLRKTTDATVLAEPQVNIADNELGKLFVGQQVPIPDNTQVSQLGGQNTTIKYKDVGVILEVTPHINNTGDVALKIRAESSTIVSGQIVLGGAVFDTRNFKTDLTAKNGQTIILGGIIQRQISDTLRKTPILGSIPGLKWAFNKKDKVTREVELIVFLRPKVVRTPEQARELLEEMDKKAPLIKKWKDENQRKEEEKPKT